VEEVVALFDIHYFRMSGRSRMILSNEPGFTWNAAAFFSPSFGKDYYLHIDSFIHVIFIFHGDFIGFVRER